MYIVLNNDEKLEVKLAVSLEDARVIEFDDIGLLREVFEDEDNKWVEKHKILEKKPIGYRDENHWKLKKVGKWYVFESRCGDIEVKFSRRCKRIKSFTEVIIQFAFGEKYVKELLGKMPRRISDKDTKKLIEAYKKEMRVTDGKAESDFFGYLRLLQDDSLIREEQVKRYYDRFIKNIENLQTKNGAKNVIS